jgi:hypothetical protein
MKKFKKPSPRASLEKKSIRSIKEEVCRETMASKYLNLLDKNKNLTKLMKKFITDPNNKMKSVCQSYYYHSNLANSNLYLGWGVFILVFVFWGMLQFFFLI